MSMRSVRTALLVGALGSLVSSWSLAQTAPGGAPAASTASTAALPAPAPVAPPPAAAPAAPPPAVPPGYMLVPVPPPDAQTRYDVQYPQARGALPPGMELPYEEGAPVPPGYHVVSQKRRGLIIGGLITTGVPWALGITAATADDFHDNTGLLLIPALGPWLLLATDTARDKSCGTDFSGVVCTESKAGLRATLVLDGLVQAAGTTMFIAGMVIPRMRLVRNDVIVSVLPAQLGHGGYGLSAIGTF